MLRLKLEHLRRCAGRDTDVTHTQTQLHEYYNYNPLRMHTEG